MARGPGVGIGDHGGTGQYRDPSGDGDRGHVCADHLLRKLSQPPGNDPSSHLAVAVCAGRRGDELRPPVSGLPYAHALLAEPPFLLSLRRTGAVTAKFRAFLSLAGRISRM